MGQFMGKMLFLYCAVETLILENVHNEALEQMNVSTNQFLLCFIASLNLRKRTDTVFWPQKLTYIVNGYKVACCKTMVLFVGLILIHRVI